MNASLLAIDFTSLKIFDFLTPIFDLFDYQQSSDDLQVVGLSSGSTFINILSTIIAFFMLLIMHLVFSMLNCAVKDNPNKNYWSKYVHQSYNGMKYGAYVRLFLESFFVF